MILDSGLLFRLPCTQELTAVFWPVATANAWRCELAQQAIHSVVIVCYKLHITNPSFDQVTSILYGVFFRQIISRNAHRLPHKTAQRTSTKYGKNAKRIIKRTHYEQKF